MGHGQEAKEPLPDEVNEVARKVVDAAYAVHKALGPGLLEGVYELCLAHEVTKKGLTAERQVNLPIDYAGVRLESGLRIDMLVGQRVIVEIKAVETILPVHKAQLLTYLKLSGYRLGLLINFNVPLIKDGISRMIL
jgi:GxxExxY protein